MSNDISQISTVAWNQSRGGMIAFYISSMTWTQCNNQGTRTDYIYIFLLTRKVLTTKFCLYSYKR